MEDYSKELLRIDRVEDDMVAFQEQLKTAAHEAQVAALNTLRELKKGLQTVILDAKMNADKANKTLEDRSPRTMKAC